jgi:hypothetical protein
MSSIWIWIMRYRNRSSSSTFESLREGDGRELMRVSGSLIVSWRMMFRVGMGWIGNAL